IRLEKPRCQNCKRGDQLAGENPVQPPPYQDETSSGCDSRFRHHHTSTCLFGSPCFHCDRDFCSLRRSCFEEAHSDGRQKRADESRKPSDRIENLRSYSKPGSLTGDNEGELSPGQHRYSNLASFTFCRGELRPSPAPPVFSKNRCCNDREDRESKGKDCAHVDERSHRDEEEDNEQVFYWSDFVQYERGLFSSYH